MDRAGIRKRHGYRVCSLIKTIFTLPFIGKSFFHGIVINKDVDFGKGAAYQVLKCSRYNWRKLVLTLAVKLHGFFNPLTSEDRESVLIIDDSTYDRSRSKVVVALTDGTPVKLVFVRDSRKTDWLALLSTDTSLDDEKIVQTYGKRWDIEVFFKMTKQLLKSAKEIHSRDYDALIAHTRIVFIRYMFLSYQHRTTADHRTYGELFYACCDEIKDISFMQALYRLLTLALASIRNMGTFCEKTVQTFFDAIINAALDCVNMSKSKIETFKI